MKNNPAYRRLEAYEDAQDVTTEEVDDDISSISAIPNGLMAQHIEGAMFPEGRPEGDGTRKISALRCYRGVLAQRERAAEAAALKQRLRDAGLPVERVSRMRNADWRLRIPQSET